MARLEDIDLEQITPLEISPTADPANRWPKLFQKSRANTDDEKEIRMSVKHAEAWLEKSKADDKVKEAFQAFMKSLNKDQSKALDEVFGLPEELVTVKKSADDTVKALDGLKVAVQKSVDLLNADKPDMLGAANILAPLVGKSSRISIDQLPAELKGYIEALQKSNEMATSQLAIVSEAQRKAEIVAKAVKDYAHIPGTPDGLAEIMMAISEKSAESFAKLLDSVEGALAKSALFTETGTLGTDDGTRGKKVTGGSEAFAKAEGMALDMVAKSGGKMTKEKAIVEVLMHHPELYEQHTKERYNR